MIRNTAFLKWWLYFGLIVLGTVTAGWFGLLGTINEADFTKISFLIYGLFAIFTVLTGINTRNACKEGADYDRLCILNDDGYFIASFLVGLGLIGTVIGFIQMSSLSFGDLRMDNVSGLKEALGNMGGGIATALYTTVVGQVCSWGLRMQLHNLARHLDFQRKQCTCNACEDPKESDEI